jgi:imidazolonepropionase-like amidohydrolase
VEEVVALENARVLPVAGPEIPKGSVLIRGGRIAAVGAAVEIPAGARRVDLAGRTVCPGFVDAASRAGLAGSDRSAGPRDPEVPSADGADLGDPVFAAARAGGVTSLVLSPGAQRGTFAGRLALVKPVPGGGLEARVADARGAIKAVLAPPGGLPSVERAAAAANLRAAFRGAVEYAEARDRYRRDLRSFLEEAAVYAAAGDAVEETLLPPAVIDRLRRLDPEPREAARRALRGRLGMKDPEKPPKAPRRPPEPREDPSKELLLAATRGEVEVRFEAHAVEDLRAALALAAEFTLRASIEGGLEAPRVAAALAKAKVPLACWPAAGPGAQDDAPPSEAVPALVVAAGVRAAVATGDRGPSAVRHLALAAAGAAGRGLDRAAALRAVTLDAAVASGFGARIGSLEPGKDADLLVLDGDPLATGTRVLAVWIDGAEVPVPEERR